MMQVITSLVHDNFTNISRAQSFYLALVVLQISLLGPYLIWTHQSKTKAAEFLRLRPIARHACYTGRDVWKLVVVGLVGASLYFGSLFLMHWFAVLMVSTVLCIASIAHMTYTIVRLSKDEHTQAAAAA
jgi:hypothetical protein